MKLERRNFSLNYIQRNNEVKRIMTENEALLKRLQSRGSTYNISEWEKDRKQQMKDIKRICKYNPSISTKKQRGKSRQRGGALNKLN